ARKIEVTAEPRLRDVETASHVLLAAAIVALKRLQIVSRPLDIAEVLAGPVLQVGDPERLFVRQLADLHEEAEVGVVVSAQPGHRPMPASAANDLEIDIRVAAHAADDGGDLLAALGLEALD